VYTAFPFGVSALIEIYAWPLLFVDAAVVGVVDADTAAAAVVVVAAVAE
jgi:hypothetical protein